MTEQKQPQAFADKTGETKKAVNCLSSVPSSMVGEIAADFPLSAETISRAIGAGNDDNGDYTAPEQGGNLSPTSAIRLIMLCRLIARARNLFEGDREKAAAWLQRPNRALGGQTPLESLSGNNGRIAENLIGRLEHGVFS